MMMQPKISQMSCQLGPNFRHKPLGLRHPCCKNLVPPRHICHGKNHTFHVEIEVEETEDDEGVCKRFRNSVTNANILYEARRRRYHENSHDLKIRKQQEKGLKKIRAKREAYILTFTDHLNGQAEDAVFGDLFPDWAQSSEATPVEAATEVPPTKTSGLDSRNFSFVRNLDSIEKSLMQERLGLDAPLDPKRWQSKRINSDTNAVNQQSKDRAQLTKTKSQKDRPFLFAKEVRAENKKHPTQDKSFDELDWEVDLAKSSKNGAGKSKSKSKQKAESPKSDNGSSVSVSDELPSNKSSEAAGKKRRQQLLSHLNKLLAKEPESLSQQEKEIAASFMPTALKEFSELQAFMGKASPNKGQKESKRRRRQTLRARLEQLEKITGTPIPAELDWRLATSSQDPAPGKSESSAKKASAPLQSVDEDPEKSRSKLINDLEQILQKKEQISRKDRELAASHVPFLLKDLIDLQNTSRQDMTKGQVVRLRQRTAAIKRRIREVAKICGVTTQASREIKGLFDEEDGSVKITADAIKTARAIFEAQFSEKHNLKEEPTPV